MKIKIFVAFVATVTIIFLSCNWFRFGKKETSNPLIGEWKLDSVKAGKDTTAIYFLIASAMKDSNGVSISFTKDSIFTHSNDAANTTAYSFDEKLNQLNIKDSTNQSFAFAKFNDSLITLTANDSAVLFLKKK